MKSLARIEQALDAAIAHAAGETCPPQLSDALRYAVFPGGARVRPRLCLAVALACGDDAPELTNAACAAIEIMHCASLVHDDMPCFDDADLRRGRPSVHAAFSEPLALLTGDAMIVLAFDILGRASVARPERLGPLVSALAGAVGMPNGITAGQAWESEDNPPLDLYHRAKTGALFIGACRLGAVAAGGDAEAWTTLGDRLGAAYQVADDLRDAAGEEDELGKPVGQDIAHARPNAVSEMGIPQALGKLDSLVRGAISAIPECRGGEMLEALIRSEAKRLVPAKLAKSAA
jgi:geranylgeranyl diphosphate synthase type II